MGVWIDGDSLEQRISLAQENNGAWRGKGGGTKVLLFQGSEVAYLWKVGTQKNLGSPATSLSGYYSPTSILPWQMSQFIENQVKRLCRRGKPNHQALCAQLTEDRTAADVSGLLIPGQALSLPTFVAIPYSFNSWEPSRILLRKFIFSSYFHVCLYGAVRSFAVQFCHQSDPICFIYPTMSSMLLDHWSTFLIFRPR